MSPEVDEANGVPEVGWLEVESLRTSLATLRSSAAPPPQGAPILAEMPLRVAAREDGSFEVVDGFKRLAHWMTAGHRQVPVLVEQASSALERKLLLLRANAPPRRTTAMDEARVVDSLVSEDNLSGEGGTGASALDQALLKRFPSLAPLVEGITVRMKSLAHIHLKALWRLAETHGGAHFLAAATRAQDYRRYSAQAVGRILDRIDPLPAEPPLPVDAATRARATLGEVDPGSLDQYRHLDTTTPGGPPSEQDNSSEPTVTKEDSDEDA